MINVILNLILIPEYSLYGAAVATVITYLLIFVLFFHLTIKYTYIKPLNLKTLLIFAGALLSGLIMYFTISQTQIYHLHTLLSISIGAIVYFVSYLILRRITQHFYRKYE